jgi:hypothetical protein
LIARTITVARAATAVLSFERRSRGRLDVAGDDLFRRDKAGPDETLCEGRGHAACADEPDLCR